MAYQSGQDVNSWTLEDLAKKLGTYGGQIGYESNDAGSFERAYNQQLSRLTPDYLLKRYSSNLNPGAYQTEVDRVQNQAYQEAKSILGRDITADEFSQIIPYFMGPNGQTVGRGYLAQLKQQEQNNPNNPRSPFNPNNPNNKLSEYNPSVQGIFNDLLQRGASQDELNHFSQLLATGQADPFTLRSFVSQLPEYRTKQDTQFRQGLSSELEASDTRAFDKQKQNVLSYFANQGGGSGHSAALDYALTDLMGKIAENRQKYLTSVTSDQYQGNKQAARGDYETYLNTLLDNQDYNRRRQDANSDYLINRRDQTQDYQRQMQDYANFISGQRQKQKFGIGDWVNLGLGIGNTASRFYQGYQSNPYNFLNGEQ